MAKDGSPITVQEAFEKRLAEDPLINFSVQAEITQSMAQLWFDREKVTGKVKFIPGPVSGYFENGEPWAVRPQTISRIKFPYVFSPAVATPHSLIAMQTFGMKLQDRGQKPALVTSFVMEQGMEREIKDSMGKLHGVPGIEMDLLYGVAKILQVGFPRGGIIVDGHGLGFEYLAEKVNWPLLTLTAMPRLFKAALDNNLVKNVRSVAVSGDVGSVMLMNHVAELAKFFGIQIQTVYGEKRSDEMFTSWGRATIKGAQVLFGDDVIRSGKTVFKKVLAKAFECGASSAVVFVTHADLIKHTLENLDDCPRAVLVIGDTFPVRPEVADRIEANGRLLRVNVFDSVLAAAKMDSQNLLTDVFCSEATQANLLKQTGLAIFPPYVERYRTVSEMLQ